MFADESINLPKQLPIWPTNKAPNPHPEDANFPNLTYYLPSSEFRTGQSILILPGGGYQMVSSAKEGHRPAQLLATQGIAAAVLEYRHAPNLYPTPLLDAQRAMRIMREQASIHNLDTKKVGIMGFSAGGHLAGMVSTQPEHSDSRIGDAIDQHSSKADFAALIYPVISMTLLFAHASSAKNLLGENPDLELIKRLSLENSVSASTPPTFLFHGQKDDIVPTDNSIIYYQALAKHGVPGTLHIDEDAEHGIGLAANHEWGKALLRWLAKR